MFRTFIAFSILSALFSAQSAFATVQVYKGTVTSVRPCYPSGYAFSLDFATTSIIYQTGFTVATPKNTIPKVGQKVYTLLDANVSCDVDPGPGVITIVGKSVSYFSSSTPQILPPAPAPGTGTPSDGSTSGSAGGSSLQGLASQITNSITQAANSFLQNTFGGSAGSAVTGAATDAAGGLSGGLPYGGTYKTVIPCIGGIFYIPDFVGATYSGPITWFAPAPLYLVNMAAPPIPTQCHVGRLVGMAECCIGGGYCFPPAPRIQFYGSSAPGCMIAPPAKPAAPVKPTNAQCPQNGTPDTPAQKVIDEAAVRDVLKNSCGKGVTVLSSQTNGAACAYHGNGITNGCTDVGNLQCGSMDELCSLAQCSAFSISGGSEYGHSGFGDAGMHGSGNAVDINHSTSIDGCIKSNFTQTTCPASLGGGPNCWKNPSTGAIYYDEPSKGKQGAHWHVCMNGFCKG